MCHRVTVVVDARVEMQSGALWGYLCSSKALCHNIRVILSKLKCHVTYDVH